MKENRNRLEELTEGYWSATLTEQEELELRHMLATDTNLTEELKALRVMMSGFELLAAEYEEVKADNPRRKTQIVKMIASLSAAAAVLAFGIITHSDITTPPEAEVYCYINGEPITDINVALEQTKYLEPLAALSQTINTLETIMLN